MGIDVGRGEEGGGLFARMEGFVGKNCQSALELRMLLDEPISHLALKILIGLV